MMKKYLSLLTFTLLFLGHQAFANQLLSSVDRYRMGEDETLTLTIVYDDANVSEQPQLAGLESLFKILSVGSSSNIKLINGERRASTQWRYSLLPKKSGKLLIPSFSLKGSFSEPIEIEVVDNESLASSQTNGSRGDLFVEATVNKREAYVQEMITLTLRIYTSVQIAQPQLPELSVPGFMIEKIANSQFQTRQFDRNYYVLQYQFALFANQSGDLIIPKQRYQIAQVINNRPRSLFDIYDFGTQTQARFLSTTEIPIRIKPMPAHKPADYWLASDDVTLSDNWSTQHQTLELGEPVTRSLEVRALGNIAANIPPLPESAVPGLKIYSEPAELNNGVSGENLLGTRRQNFAIVATAPGKYTLPEIKLHWWSNKEKKFKVSILPAQHITVKGGPLPSSPNNPTNVSPAADNDPNQTIENPMIQGSQENSAASLFRDSIWMILSLIFLLGWILTALLLFKAKRSAIKSESTDETTLHGISLKNALKQLKMACRSNDPQQARSALIHWAQLQWQNNSLLSLQEVKKQAKNPSLSSLIDELDSALYRDHSSWDGKALLEFLESGNFKDKNSKSQQGLPELYAKIP